MPQMMPINWLFLFFFFIVIMILFNIMNFYIFKNYIMNINNNKITKFKKLNWKW